MTDLHTKVLLWVIAIGIWWQMLGGFNSDIRRVLGNIDTNLASAANKLDDIAAGRR